MTRPGSRTRRGGGRPSRLLPGLYVAVILAFLFLPVLVIVPFSFNTAPRLSFPISGLTLDWYDSALTNEFFADAVRNTAMAAVCTALLAGALGSLIAFGATRLRAGAGETVVAIALLPAIVPVLLLGVALNNLLRGLDVPLNLTTVVIGHTLVATPFVTLAMMSRLAELDRSVLEAARDLGASPARAFLDVTLPLIRAALVGAMLLAAALSLDEFVATFFLRGTENTVPTLIWGLLRRGVDPTINALASMILLVTVSFAIIATRLTRVRL